MQQVFLFISNFQRFSFKGKTIVYLKKHTKEYNIFRYGFFNDGV